MGSEREKGTIAGQRENVDRIFMAMYGEPRIVYGTVNIDYVCQHKRSTVKIRALAMQCFLCVYLSHRPPAILT